MMITEVWETGMPNLEKLPEGIAGLSRKIEDMGLKVWPVGRTGIGK